MRTLSLFHLDDSNVKIVNVKLVEDKTFVPEVIFLGIEGMANFFLEVIKKLLKKGLNVEISANLEDSSLKNIKKAVVNMNILDVLEVPEVNILNFFTAFVIKVNV